MIMMVMNWTLKTKLVYMVEVTKEEKEKTFPFFAEGEYKQKKQQKILDKLKQVKKWKKKRNYVNTSMKMR